jgi:lysophospholipase L1-like esterase
MASVGVSIATFVLLLASSAQSFRARPRRSARGQVNSSLPGLVVTLGDSYASGCGVHRYGGDYDEEYGGRVSVDGVTYNLKPGDEECWREDDSTPGAVYANLSAVNKASKMYACKGATIPYVRRQFEYANAAHKEHSSEQWSQSVIVISGGGNDVTNDDGDSWPSILTTCIAPQRNPFRGCHEYPANHPTNWNAVHESLYELYKFVGTGAAQAKIRIFGYPFLFQPASGCSTVGGISTEEGEWADVQVARLNVEIASAVSRAVSDLQNSVDMKFVDVTPYITYGACDHSDRRQINDIELSWESAVSDQSFHPTQKGYDGYYRALLNSL